LIPPLKEKRKRGLKQVLTSFKEVRGRVPGKIKIRELIEEGRRF